MNRTSTTHAWLFTSFIALGTLAALACGGCSTQKAAERWTPRPCSLPLEEREALMEGLVVHVIPVGKLHFELPEKPDLDKPGTLKMGLQTVSGNALVISPTRLLMTDHQVWWPKGKIHVNGRKNHYERLRQVEGPIEGCGWTLIELETPLPMERKLPLDFKAEPKIGDTVFVASYWPFDGTGTGLQSAEEATALIARRPILIEGRVVPFPPQVKNADDEDLVRQYLLLDTRCPAGTSGSPVIWRRDDGSYAVVGLLTGEWVFERPDWLTGEPTGEIIVSVQMIRQPREYEPVENGSPQE